MILSSLLRFLFLQFFLCRFHRVFDFFVGRIRYYPKRCNNSLRIA